MSGIWMITVYTLAYAASVPIMGKLADRFGRKYVYITCIFLFGAGSLFCGLSGSFGGFAMLIAARAVQAIGGGGIVPIATAEFGTSFPPEKRGTALGLVGGVVRNSKCIRRFSRKRNTGSFRGRELEVYFFHKSSDIRIYSSMRSEEP